MTNFLRTDLFAAIGVPWMQTSSRVTPIIGDVTGISIVGNPTLDQRRHMGSRYPAVDVTGVTYTFSFEGVIYDTQEWEVLRQAAVIPGTVMGCVLNRRSGLGLVFDSIAIAGLPTRMNPAGYVTATAQCSVTDRTFRCDHVFVAKNSTGSIAATEEPTTAFFVPDENADHKSSSVAAVGVTQTDATKVLTADNAGKAWKMTAQKGVNGIEFPTGETAMNTGGVTDLFYATSGQASGWLLVGVDASPVS